MRLSQPMGSTVSVPSKNPASDSAHLIRSVLTQTYSQLSLDRIQIACLYLFCGWSIAALNLVLAHRKLLWDDEFFTLYLSKTKDWATNYGGR